MKFILVFFLLLSTSSYAQQALDVNLVPLDFGVKQSVVSVTSSATAIPSTALSGRKSIIIKNLGSTTVYLGASTVTADTASTGGLPLLQNEIFRADIGENTIIYGITSTGSSNVSVFEAR